MLNDNALSNISVDVDFLEGEFKRIGREHVNSAFGELRLVCYLVTNRSLLPRRSRFVASGRSFDR